MFWFKVSEVSIFHIQEAMTERAFQILMTRTLREWSTGGNHGRIQFHRLQTYSIWPCHMPFSTLESHRIMDLLRPWSEVRAFVILTSLETPSQMQLCTSPESSSIQFQSANLNYPVWGEAAEEVVQLWGVLAAVEEDPGSSFSVDTAVNNHPGNPNPLTSTSTRHVHGEHTYTQAKYSCI